MKLQQRSVGKSDWEGKKIPKKSEIKMMPNNPLIPLIRQESTYNWEILEA